MVTYDEYLRGILERVMESHGALSGMGDRPGDLEAMRVELLKIRGFFHVLAHKIDAGKYPSIDVAGLQSRAASYLESYDFEKEMDRLSPLYADDPSRLRNLRLTILDSLDDRRLMEYISEVAEGL